MKIGFIMSHSVFAPTNGIVSQALTWKKGLEQIGHEVVLVDMWKRNDWATFDVLHFFGFSVYMAEFIGVVHKVCPNIAVSPILDPDYSVWNLWIRSHWGCRKLNLTNPFYAFRRVKKLIRWVFVRSRFEQDYLVKGFGFDTEKCPIVPLSYGIKIPKVDLKKKEPFCLHISLLCDERKNVRRLIEAAKKYGFKLVLGGKLRNDDEKKMLTSWIGDSENIEYKGFLSSDDMLDLYKRAKVFALPSTNEGVGIVALEAAVCGCDIVVTKFGGPHEYYCGMATKVDPYNVDEIGLAINSYLNGKSYQPKLMQHVNSEYSLETTAKLLIDSYNQHD